MIPLGILGNRRGGAAAGAYELISTTLVTGTSTYTINFSSIASTYKHLQLRMVVGSNSGTALDNLKLTFNSSTSGYSRHNLTGNGSTVTSGSSLGTAFMLLGQHTGNNNEILGTYITDILDYANTSKNTTTRTLTGVKHSSNGIGLWSGLWENTAAVSSIQLDSASGGYFREGSRFSLYGIKG